MNLYEGIKGNLKGENVYSEDIFSDYSKFIKALKSIVPTMSGGKYAYNNKVWADNLLEKEFNALTKEEKEYLLNGDMSLGDAVSVSADRLNGKQVRGFKPKAHKYFNSSNHTEKYNLLISTLHDLINDIGADSTQLRNLQADLNAILDDAENLSVDVSIYSMNKTKDY